MIELRRSHSDSLIGNALQKRILVSNGALGTQIQ